MDELLSVHAPTYMPPSCQVPSFDEFISMHESLDRILGNDKNDVSRIQVYMGIYLAIHPSMPKRRHE